MPRRKSKFRKLKRILLAPFYALAYNVISLKDTFQQAMSSLGLSRDIPRHRNRDFERAGKESSLPPMVDRAATANLNNATKVRQDEIANAAIVENRLLKGRGEKSKEFREQKAKEKTSVSQGNVISHLARMQQKSKQKENADPDSDSADSQ